MKNRRAIFFSLVVLACSCGNEFYDSYSYKELTVTRISDSLHTEYIDTTYIKNQSLEILQWHLENPKFYGGKFSWSTSCLYLGNYQASKIWNYQAGIDKFDSWIKESGFKIKKNDLKIHADDYAFGQALLQYYNLVGDKQIILDLLNDVYNLIETDIDGYAIWWWSDALFMAPPVLTSLGEITGDTILYMKMDKFFSDTYLNLLNEDFNLLYRDYRYIDKKIPVFWLRGNAWVVAGITRLLESIPDENSMKAKYTEILDKMLLSLLSYQQADGLWRTNILFPEIYSLPEASGSALILYSIFKGINDGYLSEEIYLEKALVGWVGLQNCIINDRTFGYTQQPHYEPSNFDTKNYEDYGAGAYLLLAVEVYNILMK